MPLTFEAVKKDPTVNAYIKQADAALLALGYTEHSVAHVTKCAVTAARILKETNHPEDMQQLAAVAAYMHDIGNVINRTGHAQSGALMAFDLLRGVGATPEEIGTVVSAIGHHDDSTAFPVSDVTAALILADKTDVRRTRVRNRDTITFDIHDRVNYAVEQADLNINVPAGEIALHLTIDTQVSTISEYFEIFLSRMLLCRRAAERLQLKFGLVINGQGMM